MRKKGILEFWFKTAPKKEGQIWRQYKPVVKDPDTEEMLQDGNINVQINLPNDIINWSPEERDAWLNKQWFEALPTILGWIKRDFEIIEVRFYYYYCSWEEVINYTKAISKVFEDERAFVIHPIEKEGSLETIEEQNRPKPFAFFGFLINNFRLILFVIALYYVFKLLKDDD